MLKGYPGWEIKKVPILNIQNSGFRVTYFWGSDASIGWRQRSPKSLTHFYLLQYCLASSSSPAQQAQFMFVLVRSVDLPLISLCIANDK